MKSFRKQSVLYKQINSELGVMSSLAETMSKQTGGKFEATSFVFPGDKDAVTMGEIEYREHHPEPIEPEYKSPITGGKQKHHFAEGMANLLVKYLYAGDYPVKHASKLKYDLTKAMDGKAFSGYLYKQIGGLVDLIEMGADWKPVFEEIVSGWDVLLRVLAQHGIRFDSSEGVK